ncbi:MULTISPECIES: hypothetical protein [Microbacterium]|uniref:hypothetical protein n=1 Tax=Microbacterium TaxID=33882 RepID=UPI00217E42C4|nr:MULTISPECIES: hypothetical protein [Microbacterium]UWF76659.1 hypothetical protein JSY13_07185 [Microbacterium neungamense]WCM54808.1 hypothetical protein JRG78_07185 [Microbacterium sp. EF45047]
MSTVRSIRLLAAFGLAGLLALAGCAGTPGGHPPTSSAGSGGDPLGAAAPAPPEGEVTGAGTVMDHAGAAEFCLGPIAESYPPQCRGIPLAGWSWDGVDGAEASGDVRWGAYALTGRYDGETFTVTQPPILLALYDPPAPEDPTGGQPGHTAEERLLDIQAELDDRLGGDGRTYFGSYPENGYLWVDVLWDDGTYQEAADAEFGEGVVVIRSALREAG